MVLNHFMSSLSEAKDPYSVAHNVVRLTQVTVTLSKPGSFHRSYSSYRTLSGCGPSWSERSDAGVPRKLVPAPGGVGIAAGELRLDVAGRAIAYGPKQGNPIQDFAGDVARLSKPLPCSGIQ
jgi:hypothetical protein